MNKNDAPAGMIDSRLFRDQFGTAEMRAVFSDEATLGGWLEAEVSLARAQADHGLIPARAAQTIHDCAKVDRFDFTQLRAGIAVAKHPLVPAIKALEAACGKAGPYVHFGATTQDIMDTGMVLQIRTGWDIIERQLAELIAAIRKLARQHKATPMAGRTHGQHAVPITFGFKLAVIVAELRRHADRLSEARPRILVGQLSGAAGTLATLGDKADAVRQDMMRHLGLGVPAISWHTARDGIAECMFILSLIASTAGKIANEIVNLQRTEIAEVAEPAGPEATGSSTMPQKRNPMTAQSVVALARLVRGSPGHALEAMMHEHERDLSAWQSEWALVPENFIMVSGALEQLTAIMSGLQVDDTRMRENLLLTGGLISAETVMMRLANAIGRQRAHDLVEKLIKETATDGTQFIDALSANATVSAHLTRRELEDLLAPEAWLGEAVAATERILKK
ncbi:MAG: adenylosuccinate lyase [Aestuariivirgaceae bacterium]